MDLFHLSGIYITFIFRIRLMYYTDNHRLVDWMRNAAGVYFGQNETYTTKDKLRTCRWVMVSIHPPNELVSILEAILFAYVPFAYPSRAILGLARFRHCYRNPARTGVYQAACPFVIALDRPSSGQISKGIPPKCAVDLQGA